MDRAETESWIIDELVKSGARPVAVPKEDSENVVIDEAYLDRAEERARDICANDDPWTAQVIDELVAEVRRLRVVLDAQLKMS